MKKSKSKNRKRAAAVAGAAPCSASFVDFNINDYVQVKLTPYGRACLQKNYNELNAAYGGRLPFKHSPPTEDKDGWSRWQAWSLMADLGKHIAMGMNPPFETTIRVEVKTPNYDYTAHDTRARVLVKTRSK